VTVRGDDGSIILDDFSLTVSRGEVVALLGPSGAGKTTALRAVAGFARVAKGSVHLGGADVTALPPRRRGLGMVMQSYALFPHMSVGDNVAYGLRTRGVSRTESRRRAGDALEMVGMSAYADRAPRTLSGGQQQRIAIARALAPRPEVLLLDEPLSALDQQLRQDMMAELARLHRELPDITMLYVTHGQNEALTLADRIAVMANSRLVEFGTAAKLYRDPELEFTARVLGSSNVLAAEIVDRDTVRLLGGAGSVAHVAPTVQRPGLHVHFSVRPHRARLLAEHETADNVIALVVNDIQWRGATHLVSGTVNGVPFSVEALELRSLPPIGSAVRVGFDRRDAILLRAEGDGTALAATLDPVAARALEEADARGVVGQGVPA
jgi:2-aminoethylphosphonate transport system ATP-binding protein